VPRKLPDERLDKGFSVIVNEEFSGVLEKLGGCSTIFVLFYQDRPIGPSDRPNPIGSQVVHVFGVSGNVVRISAIGALDETPILDIQPLKPSIG